MSYIVMQVLKEVCARVCSHTLSYERACLRLHLSQTRGHHGRGGHRGHSANALVSRYGDDLSRGGGGSSSDRPLLRVNHLSCSSSCSLG